MKTLFTHNDMFLRISKDSCGNDRFTEKEIIKYMDNNEIEVTGDKDHCLCLKSNGSVLAEIVI